MIRVALVDDQQLVRAGFAMVIDSQDDMSVAWAVGDGVEAVRAAQDDPVDIILMDIQMPRMNGITATREILAQGGSTKIIGLTTFDNDDYVLGTLGAGASGFLLKDAEPEELLHAVRTVASGEAVIAAKSTKRLLRHVRPHLEHPLTDSSKQQGITKMSMPEDPNFGLADPLTPKELEVTKLIALGYTNTQIAERLFVSMSTVKTHISRILAKTQSADRVHVVLFAFRHHIVDAETLLAAESDTAN